MMLSEIKQLATDVRQKGGRLYLVGGTVRDALLKLLVKDYDVEIYGLPPEAIQKIVQPYGAVKEVGQAFGILKLTIGSHTVDVAAPRRDSKVAAGHRGFAVSVDPHLSTQEASRRRDFTINAMLQDPLTGEVVDHFGGQKDLADRILRVTYTTTFIEDPLRVLRAFQFAARFELTVEPKTKQLLHQMLPSLKELSPQRVREEWIKLFFQAKRPSIGLALAMEIGYFDPFPEFGKMRKTMQGAEVHPEGDVWTHTLMTVDKAADLAERDHLTDETRLVCLLAALCHDVGKPATIQQEGDTLTVHGHAQAGVRPGRDFLRSQGFPEAVIEPAMSLVKHHMDLHELYESDRRAPITDGAIRRLLNRLKPATIQQLVTVGEADFLGRGPWIGKHGQEVWPRRYPRKEWFLERLDRAKLTDDPPTIIQGRDLIARGWKPGPDFGRIIVAAEKCAEEQGADQASLLAIIAAAESPERALRALQERLVGGAEK